MNIFDKIFQKLKPSKKEDKKDNKDIIAYCSYCNMPIFKNEKYKTLNYKGNHYILHLKCYRKLRKEAYNKIKNQNF